MTLRYLPEHAESALLALDVARKEAAHLQYTHILFSTVARIDAEATSLGLTVDKLPNSTNHDG